MRTSVTAIAAVWLIILGCSGDESPSPKCESSADCGEGAVCVEGRCTGSESGCAAPCEAPTPLCHEPTGSCVHCLGDGQGCANATPFCDPVADDGRGACVACRDNGDCGNGTVCDPIAHVCVGCTDEQGCSGATPICDRSSSDGICVRCTADGTGCGGTTPLCDTTVPPHECVGCLEGADCTVGLQCDPSRHECVVCSATVACSGALSKCDASANGGRGRCVECLGDGDCAGGQICEANACVTCSRARGCLPGTPVCVPSANGGDGRCVVCAANGDCDAAAPICIPDAGDGLGRCVVCTSDAHCPSGLPLCMVGANDGAGSCVECLSDAECPGGKCDPSTNSCVGCLTDTDCSADSPVCDSASQACVVCTPSAGCGLSASICDTSTPGGTCIECRSNIDCAQDESCERGICVFGGTGPALTALRLSTFPPVTVDRGRVTALHPVEGFWVQAGPVGPAALVEVPPSDLTPSPLPGDRVTFTIEGTGGQHAISSWSVLSRGHPLNPLTSTIQPCGPVSATCVGCLAHTTGTLEPYSANHDYRFVTPAGCRYPDYALRLLFFENLAVELGIRDGGDVTARGPLVAEGTMGIIEQAAMQVHSRPPFQVLSASPFSHEELHIYFSRRIDPASLDPSGSQFRVVPSLPIYGAMVEGDGTGVRLTTGVQYPQRRYDISLTSPLRDPWGNPSTTGTVTTYGAVGLPELEFSEINGNINFPEHDLIEMRVIMHGKLPGSYISLDGLAGGSVIVDLNRILYIGDIIVIHLAELPSPGCDESQTDRNCPDINFPNAINLWAGLHNIGDVDLPFTNTVLTARTVNGDIIDAVPLAIPGLSNPPAEFTTGLQSLQAAGAWSPANCGGAPCTYTTSPSAVEIAVDWRGLGTWASGPSLSRKPGPSTRSSSDWNAAGPSSFGAPNP